MKKLLMSSMVILLFTASITLVQFSCSKSTAQSNPPVAQIGKIIFAQYQAGASTGIYTANYDGTGQTLANIVLPAGYTRTNLHHPALSPDGTKIFFVAYQLSATNARSIFSCNLDGSNLVRIVDCPNAAEIQLGGAY